jgi:hypothetical protein
MIPSIGTAALKKRPGFQNNCLIPNRNARRFVSPADYERLAQRAELRARKKSSAK